MITVMLYSREDCHLCEQAKTDLDALQDRYPHRLVVVDVDSSQELRQAYGFEVPVVEIGPYRLKAPFDRQELQITLGAANDRKQHLESLQDPAYTDLVRRSRTWTKSDGLAYWFTRHYLALFNLFVLIYVGLPFLAPAMMAAGIEAPARLIYRSYSLVCHQLAYRSFFLFGEQVVYPRSAAGVEGSLTYAQASGLGEGSTSDDLYAAREFTGNRAMGYKIALCERDVSIYAAILFFGLLYAFSSRRIPPLPWYLWLLLGILPIGLDGFSQLFSQPPFNFLPFRESTPLVRSLTGFLFGFTTAWLGYPLAEQSMRESREIMAKKLWAVKRET
jgi:uncharacterized membrane protein